MATPLKPWTLALLVVLLCAAPVAGLLWWRSRPQLDVASQLSRLPADSGAVFFINVSQLRRAGILHLLEINRAAEEPDYRTFVNATGFDWKQDLDSALFTQRELERFFLVTGRFDWRKISAYARSGPDGGCQYSLCWLAGTQPDTVISLYPLRAAMLAMATGNSRFGASELETRRHAVKIEYPNDPVWIYLPRKTLSASPPGPAPVEAFQSALRDADSAVLSLGGTVASVEIKLNARFATAEAAQAASTRLTGSTAALASMLKQAGQTPNEAELTGVLTAGAFRVDGARVQGRWPVSRLFIETLVK